MYSDSFLHGAHSDTGMIYVQGHRGARGVLPENTLQGIEYALSLGVQSIEMDVLATRDDIIVVTHNTSLHPDTTRTMSGEWVDAHTFRVRDLTMKQLQDFNVGACRSAVGIKNGLLTNAASILQRFLRSPMFSNFWFSLDMI